ncbi:MAG: DedA family protein [Gemmatimonadetes bacterium]|nr:DedA family protein [Gemmatimonadota bacterium]
MNELLAWVSGIDLTTLYALLALVAFIESIFPPAPADVVVAFGAFLAARRGANYSIVVAAIVGGSAVGAMVVYGVARRFGADSMHAQLRRLKLIGAEEKLEALYAHYGLAALFVSRFVPGLRAVVPPMAGALRVPWIRTFMVITVASTVWYGLIIWLSFRVGADWEQVKATLHVVGRRVGVSAVVVAVVLGVIGRRLWKRHRAKHHHAT